MGMTEEKRGALRLVPYMGVIYVVAEAHKLGFTNGHPDWCNLGQGQPEVGEMEGAPPRYSKINIPIEDHAYGPVHGTDEFRKLVAEHYNRLYRKGKDSKYGAENVAVASGGRLALSRAMLALGKINIGYQLPDYTAYEDMLGAQMHRAKPISIVARENDGFGIPVTRLERQIDELGLNALVISNPCNPTGRVVQAEDLACWVRLAREKKCTFLIDEFYSHYIYTAAGGPAAGPVSAALYVDHVDKDPVLLFDGLTKCFRYPGWRVGWVVGPKDLIECMITAGSSIDGGPGRVMQRAAMEILEPSRADQETDALRRVFAKKRTTLVEGLKALGIRFAREPEGTFYAWGCLDQLPEPFNDSETFFRKALLNKVITVPGPFFDVNPGKRRKGKSPYWQWMRFSYGPEMNSVLMGLRRLENMLKS